MPASVEFCESNQAGQVVTHNISNSNFGNADLVNMDAPTHAIIPGQRSVAKYHRLHVTNMNTSSLIDDIRIWLTDPPIQGATHKSNLKTASYGGAHAYATPVASAITGVDQDVPTALPSSANLGIAGALAGALAAIGYSDYVIHQILTGANDIIGAASDINIQYGEVL